jgi:streptogramin lyase
MSKLRRLPLLLVLLVVVAAVAPSAGAGGPAARGLKLVATIRVAGWPSAPATTPGAVWVPTTQHSGLVRIDTATNRATTPIAGTDSGAARVEHFDTALSAFGALWVSSDYGHYVRRVDPATGQETGRFTLPGRICQVAAGAGSLWVCPLFTGDVVRVDPQTLAHKETIHVGTGAAGNTVGVAASDSAGVWALDADGPSAVRIDPTTNAVTGRVGIQTKFPLSAGYLPALWPAVGAGSVWALNQLRDALVRIDPRTNRVVAAIRMPVGADPFGIALGGGAVWVVDDSYLVRIDPRTNRVSGWARFPRAGHSAFNGVVWADGSAWVTNLDRNAVYRISPAH